MATCHRLRGDIGGMENSVDGSVVDALWVGRRSQCWCSTKSFESFVVWCFALDASTTTIIVLKANRSWRDRINRSWMNDKRTLDSQHHHGACVAAASISHHHRLLNPNQPQPSNVFIAWYLQYGPNRAETSKNRKRGGR